MLNNKHIPQVIATGFLCLALVSNFVNASKMSKVVKSNKDNKVVKSSENQLAKSILGLGIDGPPYTTCLKVNNL